MVKTYKQWDDFVGLALSILENDPFRSKIITKYNHIKKQLVVKATDNKNMVLCKLKNQKDFDNFEQFYVLVAKLLSNNKWEDDEPIEEEKTVKKDSKKNKNKKKGGKKN